MIWYLITGCIVVNAFVVLYWLVKRRTSNDLDLLGVSDESTVENTELDEQQPVQPEQSIEPIYHEVITIMTIADKDRPYSGFELLQTLLTNGLRFGKYKIFHYFELDKTLFSLASATKPGTFDMNNMAQFASPGLCLFMQLKPDEHLETSFEKMLQTAQKIVKELGGYVMTDQREELTDSRIQQLRIKVRQYQQKADEQLEVVDEYDYAE